MVADRGLITGDNIFQTLSDGNGYLLSYSIRGSEKAFKDYVLDPAGYIQKKDSFRIKSRLAPRNIRVTDVLTGKKKDLMVDEKHMVFYSPAYAKKAKMEREEVLKKAKSMIQEPQKYTRSTSYGAAKYVKNLSFDKETDEILTHTGKALEIDEKLIPKASLSVSSQNFSSQSVRQIHPTEFYCFFKTVLRTVFIKCDTVMLFLP